MTPVFCIGDVIFKVLENNGNKDQHLALRIKFHQMTSYNKEWSSSVVDQLAVVESLHKLLTSEPDSYGARRASPAEVYPYITYKSYFTLIVFFSAIFKKDI